jgi:hypothetical protein
MEAAAKAIINDPDNSDNPHGKTGKMKRWGRLKHNMVSEAVIHFGKGHDNKIKDGGSLEVINKNFNAWVKDNGMAGQVLQPVFHCDEKGGNHVHILFLHTDPKTGRRVDYKRKSILSDLQTRIASGMDEFGLKRGDNWDEKPQNKKRHESIKEYQSRMDKEKELDQRLADKQKQLDFVAENPIAAVLGLATEYRNTHCASAERTQGWDDNKKPIIVIDYSPMNSKMWTDFVQTIPEAFIPYLNYAAHDVKLAHESIKTKYGYQPISPSIGATTGVKR